MEMLNFPLYAENINNETYVKTDYSTSFVYLHGELEKENGFDLLGTTKSDHSNCDLGLNDGVYLVNVIFANGKTEKCLLWYWHSPIKFKLEDFFGLQRQKMPVQINNGCQKGLICRIGDNESNEYALEMFNARAEHL